jgi:hypothetical protein
MVRRFVLVILAGIVGIGRQSDSPARLKTRFGFVVSLIVQTGLISIPVVSELLNHREHRGHREREERNNNSDVNGFDMNQRRTWQYRHLTF